MENGREKEIDVLLRGHARREHGASTKEGPHGSSALPETSHMDADALIAFSENSLPSSARARYMEHLAECDRCRQLLVQLSATMPVHNQADAQEALPSSPTFIERLLAIFRMPALRYGLPVAAVVVLVSTVLFTTINSRKSETVARREASSPVIPQEAENDHARGKGEQAPPATAESSAQIDSETNNRVVETATTAPTAAQSPKSAQGLRKQQNEELDNARVNGEVASAQKEAAPPQQFDDKVEKRRDEYAQLKGSVSSNAVAGKAEQEPSASDLAKTTEQSAAREEKSSDKRAALDAASGAKKDADAPAFSYTPAAPAASASRRKAGVAAERESSAAAATASTNSQPKAPQVRSVAGKQFRRVEGGWLDLASNPSQSAISVKRGSEQFRALIADEPGLRPYVEQLSGSVTVVWQGRQYRFY